MRECKNCEFWDGEFNPRQDKGWGVCRRFPPSVVRDNEHGEWINAVPMTFGEKSWCGEFRIKGYQE